MPRWDFVPLAGPDGYRATRPDHNLLGPGSQLQSASGLFQSADQGLGDRARAADGDKKTARRGQQSQDEADPRAGHVVRTQVNVKSQIRNNSPGRLRLEQSFGETSGRTQAVQPQPGKVHRSQTPG